MFRSERGWLFVKSSIIQRVSIIVEKWSRHTGDTHILVLQRVLIFTAWGNSQPYRGPYFHKGIISVLRTLGSQF